MFGKFVGITQFETPAALAPQGERLWEKWLKSRPLYCLIIDNIFNLIYFLALGFVFLRTNLINIDVLRDDCYHQLKSL